jgi:hypothetical protein
MHVGADVGTHVSPAFDGAGVGARVGVGAATATLANMTPGMAHGDAGRHVHARTCTHAQAGGLDYVSSQLAHASIGSALLPLLWA